MKRWMYIGVALAAALLLFLPRIPRVRQADEVSAVSAGGLCTPDQRAPDFTDYSLPCVSGPSAFTQVPQPNFRPDPGSGFLHLHAVGLRKSSARSRADRVLLPEPGGAKYLHALMNLRL